ncbi:hypothetical protein Trco_005862 [Trichoderma cornu-damae]|uniref:Uncharacterized protein n=1 Tax=Trichoderma cornu-damae TaxID=654480 RepID=A0A9P8TVM2_9HYPO|nr:hypothetical protein Trco_005862 [Trichoderma cornu-damae]
MQRCTSSIINDNGPAGIFHNDHFICRADYLGLLERRAVIIWKRPFDAYAFDIPYGLVIQRMLSILLTMVVTVGLRWRGSLRLVRDFGTAGMYGTE